jgi:hypothetical protein
VLRVLPFSHANRQSSWLTLSHRRRRSFNNGPVPVRRRITLLLVVIILGTTPGWWFTRGDRPTHGAQILNDVWRREPDLITLRPALPGSWLVNARFERSGDLGLTVSTQGATDTSLSEQARQAWRLDPSTGGSSPVPATAHPRLKLSTVSLAPDGQVVAYATGTSDLTASLWPAAGARQSAGGTSTAAVLISNVDGTAHAPCFSSSIGQVFRVLRPSA